MATYTNAARASELIDKVRSLNNRLLHTLGEVQDLRSRLAQLTAGDRAAVAQAVIDMGYDATEVETVLSKLGSVREHAVVTQGLTILPG